MRCPVCEANKDGKCMAGVVPYKSKRELDGIGCNMNRKTIKKRMREKSVVGIYIPNMTEEMAKEHLRGFIYIPVPPHGRLIDGDEFFASLSMDDKTTIVEAMHINELLAAAPTIIPADKEGEG